MKLVTTARQLRSALAMVKGVVQKRNSYPVLGCVLFDGQTVTATDLDMTLRVTIATSEARGKAAIEYFSLSGLLAHVPADENVVIEGGKESVTIIFGTSRYTLPCFDPDGFPTLKGDGGKAGDSVAGAALLGPLRAVQACISNEETRYYLNGVCFSRGHDGKPVLVATDGHRLAAARLAFDAPWLDGRIVPAFAVALLNRIGGTPTIETITGDDTALRFVWPGMVLVTKLIVGTFPDWKRVAPLPEPGWPSVTLEAAPLMGSLRRLTALSNSRRSSKPVTVAFGRGAAVARLVSPDYGEGIERLAPTDMWPGQAGQQAICINGLYFMDMLRLFQASDTIRLAFKDNGSPVTFSSPDVDLHAVQMPMRGQDDAKALAALESDHLGMVAAE